MAETCTHCPDHCPAPVLPDAALAGIPPVPRRGGGNGTGTSTDAAFYRKVASIYRKARERHPQQPATAVLLANPHLTRDQLRRAVNRARVLGYLEPVRTSVADPVSPRPRPAVEQDRTPEPAPLTHPGLDAYLDSPMGTLLERMGALPEPVHLVANGMAADDADAQLLRAAIRAARR